MRLAIHQINFIPWMPFFEKMSKCDIFVLMVHCQYEKNGWQNRCKVNGKWWTRPIKKGTAPISQKQYYDGSKMMDVNIPMIFAMARILGIDTAKIKLDFHTELRKTERIVEICKNYGADEYLTNPDATEKYLDNELLEKAGITVVPFVAKHKKHVFEMFSVHGVEKTMNFLKEE